MLSYRTGVYSLANIWYNRNMEKNIFTIEENTLSYGRGYVYSLQYNLIWCTKYRKKKSGKAAVPVPSGIKEAAVGRSFMEPLLLCGDGQ